MLLNYHEAKVQPKCIMLASLLGQKMHFSGYNKVTFMT